MSFAKGYTSQSPGILLYHAAILFGYHGNQVTCKRAAKAILKMGIGGAYRNNFKMPVYLCPSVVWSFPAEVGWTHIPRRCSKNSWSWTGWRWIAWSREESGSREVNSSGRNPAVRKLGKWSEFRVFRRSLLLFLTQCFPSSCGGDYVSFECDSVKCFVNPTPNTTCFMFYFLQNFPNEPFPSPFIKWGGLLCFATPIRGFFPQMEGGFPSPPPLPPPRNNRECSDKRKMNYFLYFIKKMSSLVTVLLCGDFISVGVVKWSLSLGQNVTL